MPPTGADAEALHALGDAVTGADVSSGEQSDARLSAPMLRLLRAVETLPAPGPTAVAAELGVGVPAVSRLVDRAVAAGLLARRGSERDRREVVLSATRAGSAVLRDWSRTRTGALADAVDGLGPDHRRALAARLARHTSQGAPDPGDARRPSPAASDPSTGRASEPSTGREPGDPAAATGRLVAELLRAEPDRVCDTLTAAVAAETGARRVVLRLTDFGVRNLHAVSWTGRGRRPADEPVDGPGPAAACLRTGRSAVRGGAAAVLDVPLVAGGERAGVISLAGLPDPVDAAGPVARAMAAAFTLALPGLVRGHDALADLRRTRDFTVSAEMQWQQLNGRGARTRRLAVAAQTEPAFAAGNESYDWACSGDRVQLAVLDCSGSRERAATATALALGALRNARRRGLGIDRQAGLVDQAVWEQFGGDVSAEALLVDVDLAGPVTASVVSTGRIGLFRHRGGTVAEPPVEAALPLGMFDGSRYAAQVLDAEVGDRFVVMTDGLGSLSDPDSPAARDLRLELVGDRSVLPAEVVRRLLWAAGDDPAGDATAVCVDLLA